MDKRNDIMIHDDERKSSVSRRSFLKSTGLASAGVAFGGSSVLALSSDVAAAAPTTIENFEDNDIAEYTGHTSYYSITSSSDANTIEGNHSLKADQPYGNIANGSISTPRGYEYRCRIVPGTGSRPGLLTCVQDPANPLKQCYWLFIAEDYNTLELYYQYGSSSGDSTRLAKVSTTITAGTEYQLALELKADTIKGVLYDSAGSELVSTTSISDTNYSDGSLGFHTGADAPAYYDFVTKETLSGSSGSDGDGGESENSVLSIPGGGCVVDDFGDNDLSEYQIDGDLSAVNTVSSPIRHGSHSLEVDGSANVYSLSGLPHYPSAGTKSKLWIYLTPGAGQVDIIYGAQDSWTGYDILIDADQGNFGLWRNTSEGSYEINHKSDTVSIPTDEWLEITIEWPRDKGDSHIVWIHDTAGNLVTAAGAPVDFNGWSTGGISFRSGFEPTGSFYIDSVAICEKDDTGAGILVDGFEDATIDDYDFDRGKSGASIVPSPTFSGSGALKISGTNTEVYKITGLPNEPRMGDVFNYWVRAEDGASHINLCYGVQNDESQSRYFVRLDFDDDRLKLYKYTGDYTLLAKKTSGFSLSYDRWYNVEVDWRTNGRHIVSIIAGEEVAYIVGEDSSWTSGGIEYDAYLASSGGTVYFDSIVKGEYQMPDVSAVVDDFDDGNLSEYQVLEGSIGSSVKTVTDPSLCGPYSLMLQDSDVDLRSTSGLPNYPSAGDRFEIWTRASGGAKRVQLLYGIQTSSNEFYRIDVDFATNELALYRVASGSQTELAAQRSGFALCNDRWFRVEVDWRTSGDHKIELYNDSEDLLATIPAVDNSWVSGGIGYRSSLSAGEQIYIDTVLVDQFYDEMKQLREVHGPVIDVASEQTDSTTEQITYHFDDGHTKVVTREDLAGGTIKMTTNGVRYWQREIDEQMNRLYAMKEQMKNIDHYGGH